MGATPEITVADLVRRKLEQARTQLIERNLRNKLVNCGVTSKRSVQIRVVDELADEVFKTLLAQKREMTFAPSRSAARSEEGTPEDPDYGDWAPPEDDPVDADGVARRHRDSVLQTRLTAEGLQKRLTGLYYQSIESEEEQGINVLYLALGFLKWFEDPRSEVERYAPLVLLPVELNREGARERFKLKARDEDLFTNVSLKVWLAEQHRIELPDLPESEDWLPSTYFQMVRQAIANAPRWEVMESEILLGFFSFNKILLWRDLDPAKWPHLLEHGVLRTLLAPHEENVQAESPIVPEDARIDDAFKSADQVTILNTDSSQTLAIQTAIAGRNLVIQGPPGTGKSQTIANIIAASIHRGKTVLFVAEKAAALQVVHDRLKAEGLGGLCFELHSRKASKQQVLSQLREALDLASPGKPPSALCEKLDTVVSSLWAHSDRLHTPRQPTGWTPYGVIGRICRLQDKGTPTPDFKITGAENWTGEQIEAFLGLMLDAAERLRLAGVPARHPWRGSERPYVNPLDGQRLKATVSKLSVSLDGLFIMMRSLWSLVRPNESDDLRNLKYCELPLVVQALELVAAKPNERLEVLGAPQWHEEWPKLAQLADIARKLHELETRLATIFTDAAWGRDWSAERTEIAGSGQSWLRILRGPYREAMRAYRGACKAGLPKSYDERLAALDDLMVAQGLRRQLSELRAGDSADLGEIWPALPAAWQRVATLSDWFKATAQIEPRLSVRNTRLLNWSDAPKQWADRLRTLAGNIAGQLTQLSEFLQLKTPQVAGAVEAIEVSLGDLLDRSRGWLENPERFNEWPPVREHLERLQAVADGGFALRVYRGEMSPDSLVDRVALTICEQVWNHMCALAAELASSDGRTLDRLVAEFRTLDKQRVKAASAEVARYHFDHKPTGHLGEMATVRQEVNKKSRHLPVRKLLESAGNAIQALKPVFLMSPLSVAQYLTPGRLGFDVLLIDEASQVRPEDALGAVARAGQIVVVGDGKQLPPTNFFNRLVAEEDQPTDPDDDYGTPVIGAMESILSLCDATLANRTMLRWHYRSQHPALIAVSNSSFYDRGLLLPPSAFIGLHADGLGLLFHKTPSGSYDRGKSHTNVAEAELIADAVMRSARNAPDKTLGVGTFSVAQRDVIRERIDARRREEPELESFFNPSRAYPFFVKNLESIQGDERDIIFISVGYGRDKEGRLSQNFGPINNDGGERRLNVLISRAKERCEVFSSLTGDDIDDTTRRAGVSALKKFLTYADKGYLDVPSTTGRAYDSDFEESVAEFLRQRRFAVDQQVGMAGFYIDLGVRSDAKSNRYLLGVECDGATYHSSRSARDRDRIRQGILEDRGWKIHRVWSTDWFNRRNGEEHRLIDALEKARQVPINIPRPASVSPIKAAAPSNNVQQSSRNGSSNGALERPSAAYEEAAFRVESSLAPHEAQASDVQGAVRRIVKIEGPVHSDEVGRRLATVWGLERAGSRIQEAALRALGALKKNGELREEKEFWHSAESLALAARDRSQVNSSTLRKPEYLPPMEIVAAARDIVKENVRVAQSELVTEVARRLGFLRVGAELQERIESAIGAGLGRHYQRTADGSLMLVPAADIS